MKSGGPISVSFFSLVIYITCWLAFPNDLTRFLDDMSQHLQTVLGSVPEPTLKLISIFIPLVAIWIVVSAFGYLCNLIKDCIISWFCVKRFHGVWKFRIDDTIHDYIYIKRHFLSAFLSFQCFEPKLLYRRHNTSDDNLSGDSFEFDYQIISHVETKDRKKKDTVLIMGSDQDNQKTMIVELKMEKHTKNKKYKILAYYLDGGLKARLSAVKVQSSAEKIHKSILRKNDPQKSLSDLLDELIRKQTT